MGLRLHLIEILADLPSLALGTVLALSPFGFFRTPQMRGAGSLTDTARERVVGVVRVLLVGLAVLWAFFACPRPAQAIPSLQLDIDGGVYDPVTQTTIATSDTFTLRVFLIPDSH